MYYLSFLLLLKKRSRALRQLDGLSLKVPRLLFVCNGDRFYVVAAPKIWSSFSLALHLSIFVTLPIRDQFEDSLLPSLLSIIFLLEDDWAFCVGSPLLKAICKNFFISIYAGIPSQERPTESKIRYPRASLTEAQWNRKNPSPTRSFTGYEHLIFWTVTPWPAEH